MNVCWTNLSVWSWWCVRRGLRPPANISASKKRHPWSSHDLFKFIYFLLLNAVRKRFSPLSFFAFGSTNETLLCLCCASFETRQTKGWTGVHYYFILTVPIPGAPERNSSCACRVCVQHLTNHHWQMFSATLIHIVLARRRLFNFLVYGLDVIGLAKPYLSFAFKLYTIFFCFMLWHTHAIWFGSFSICSPSQRCFITSARPLHGRSVTPEICIPHRFHLYPVAQFERRQRERVEIN